MLKVAIYGKGGIGKSTITSNLAAAFAAMGKKVIQIGCDPKADSTINLLGGEPLRPVMNYMREEDEEPEELSDIAKEGYGGVLCIETGGPTPGLGCAGRGIIATFQLLEDLQLFETYKPDVVLYDVLGDVVCGGFAAPIREGYAEKVLIVTSGEKMALYAANNISSAVRNFEDRSYARVFGIVLNHRNVENETEKVQAFSKKSGIPIVGEIPRSDDIYGIIGMSGAGKSTLVRCINLLERPTEGSVVIDGTAMETLSPAALRERRRDITMIFQQFNLLMQRSCLKNICFPMELAGVKKEEAEKRAKELLEMVGLPDKANAYPAQLSGGQKQRIAIARALATDPKVLLCDEATSALDPNTTHSILTLIKDINRKLGITVVVITHQMSVVEEICDHVAILDGGVVVEQGEVKEIFANPKTTAAKRLVAPNGGSAARDLSSFAPDDHVVRVTFNGSSAAKPLVASLAAEKGILVSVLSADTRDLSGQCYGSMLLKLPTDLDEAKQAAAYMRAQPGITVEEVTGE